MAPPTAPVRSRRSWRISPSGSALPDIGSSISRSPGSRPPGRTLWHALYFPEEGRMQVSFYLRDEAVPDQPSKSRIVRSEYREFALKPSKP